MLVKKILLFIVFQLILTSFLIGENLINDETNENEGINSGLVVVYGKVIEPPYFITYNEDSLMINDTTIYPRKKDPTIKEVEINVSELDKYKFELMQKFRQDFVDYYNNYGLEEARNRIKQQYLQDSLITRIDIQFEEKDRIITVFYNDGNRSNMGFYKGYRMIDGKLVELPKASQLDILKEQKKQMTQALNSNIIIAFGYDYNIHLPSENITKINYIINKIINNEIDLEEGKKVLGKTVHSNKLANDIINNISTWRSK